MDIKYQIEGEWSYRRISKELVNTLNVNPPCTVDETLALAAYSKRVKEILSWSNKKSMGLASVYIDQDIKPLNDKTIND